MKNLVIVESPTKAKTISKFLGKDYKVLSSFGHIRDLPKKELGVEVDKDFAPRYVIPTKSKKIASDLKKAAEAADTIYFASDEDREGEAIAWHLMELLKLKEKDAQRITFHEITKEAITRAIEHPRKIDLRLVDAQQARRVLDRLVGYELSPFLWRKVARGLSAGRVQSVIVRLLVEREREVKQFVAKEYWSIEALLRGGDADFTARLSKKDGESLDKLAIADQGSADAIVADLDGASWTVESIERKNVRRTPPPPFTTSTLQQDGNNKLGFSAKQTMMLAQQLYEGVELGEEGPTGLITYMRTDSVNLSANFLEDARKYLIARFGKDSVPEEPRKYKTKSKSAQEAHEAIRPSSVDRTPESLSSHLDDRQLKLYELIWRRAVASQMAEAEMLTVGANIAAAAPKRPSYTFRATGSTIAKKGYLELYETEEPEGILPELSENQKLDARSVTPKQHFTEPPPRFTEASLVKTLEENGIGRPSTYAPTISTVVDRGYVEKDGRKLKPTELAFLVNDLLVEHFPDIVDFQFTAHMEESLDAIADGEKEWVPVIRAFYEPFKKTLTKKEKEVSKKSVTEAATDQVCEKCGKPMVIKIGRFGKFLACTGFPACRNTKHIPNPDSPQTDEPATTEKCPTCEAPMMVKRGRFGEFLSCSRYPDCKTVRPIMRKIGVPCPKCEKGDMIEKKTRRGKMFYACSRYPDCDFALWQRPTGEKCPTCGSLIAFAKAELVRCTNKECGYEREMKKE